MEKIYIETTIPSFYFETRRNAECISRRNWTRRWWDNHRHEYQLLTSQIVREELGEPGYSEEKRRQALRLLDEVPLLDMAPRLDEIVRVYVGNLLMPRQPVADAIHLAMASLYDCDILLTWNCAHLANPNKRRHIETINKELGIMTPMVITPLELLGDAV